MGLPPPPTSLKVLFSHLKVVWKHWNVHSLILASFTVQLFLVLFAPFRKKSSNRFLMVSLWLAYLMADWIAIIAIGVISDPCGSLTEAKVGPDVELYAFWGQFLLLHLGGPDTITALALEDNELWLRTGLHLAVQVYGSLGIVVKSVAHSQTSLWIPTLLMFAAGVIKYAERLSSMFHGRLLKFCNSRLPMYSGSRFVLASRALISFHHLHFLYVGSMPWDEKMSAKDMIGTSPEKAFKALEIHFNLAYEALYTKTALVCLKWRWEILRLAVTLLQVGCLVIWLFFTDKHGFKEYNILLTYTLLVGAIALDVFGFLMIHIWSEWSRCLDSFLSSVFDERVFWYWKRNWGRYTRREDAPFWACFRRALFRQWSETIPQLSLLSLWMEDKSNKLQKLMGFEEGIYQSKYVSSKWFSDHLRDFLHEDLKTKRMLRGGIENIGKVKGGWACHRLISNYGTGMINIPSICQLVDINKDHFKVLLRWHIVTEICYRGEHINFDNDVAILSIGNEPKNSNATNTDGSDNKINYREICKTLSDYLMYLLVQRQDMMTLPYYAKSCLEEGYLAVKLEFGKLFSTRFKEDDSVEDSESYFYKFPATDILNELEELKGKQIDVWQFMAEVWGELLYYAAIHCDPKVHLTNVKQGGELLSFVWWWLAYFGFGLPENGSKRREKALLHMSSLEECENPDLNYVDGN